MRNFCERSQLQAFACAFYCKYSTWVKGSAGGVAGLECGAGQRNGRLNRVALSCAACRATAAPEAQTDGHSVAAEAEPETAQEVDNAAINDNPFIEA